MSAYKSDFLNVLADRGFIHQVSEPETLDARAKAGAITAYIGFDCTAASLHIGSLLPIMMLHWLQQTGHRPIALMGGGTTRVGDPSGKDETRRVLTDEAISGNLKGIRAVFSKFLKFEDAGGNAVMANNADWLNKLNYIDFLRDVGRHFSVNRMLSFDSVKMRLDRQQELSFLEFNYMVLQAYDFVELNKRYDCILQMGGSDQWGNIVNGIDLGRRMRECAIVRADVAADHDFVRRQDGQDRGRRGVAQRRSGEPIRLLAVLAQHRGRRCRPFPQAVHCAAARRDRASRRPKGQRDQRGEESSRNRSDRPRARPRRRQRKLPKPHAKPSKKARLPRHCRPSRSSSTRIRSTYCRCARLVPSLQPAKRAVKSRMAELN